MSALCTQCMRIAQCIHTADAMPGRLEFSHLLVSALLMLQAGDSAHASDLGSGSCK